MNFLPAFCFLQTSLWSAVDNVARDTRNGKDCLRPWLLLWLRVARGYIQCTGWNVQGKHTGASIAEYTAFPWQIYADESVNTWTLTNKFSASSDRWQTNRSGESQAGMLLAGNLTASMETVVGKSPAIVGTLLLGRKRALLSNGFGFAGCRRGTPMISSWKVEKRCANLFIRPWLLDIGLKKWCYSSSCLGTVCYPGGLVR